MNKDKVLKIAKKNIFEKRKSFFCNILQKKKKNGAQIRSAAMLKVYLRTDIFLIFNLLPTLNFYLVPESQNLYDIP